MTLKAIHIQTNPIGKKVLLFSRSNLPRKIYLEVTFEEPAITASQSFLVLSTGTLQVPIGPSSSLRNTFNQFWQSITRS